MKILLPTIISGAIAFSFVLAQQEGPAEKAKDAAEDTAETAKNVAKDTAKGVKKAVKEVTSDVTHRINVTMAEYHFNMPSTTRPGLTTFVIKNAGRKEHTFAIKGEGVDQKLTPNLKPGQTESLQVNLKPGTYEITCPVDFHTMRGMKTTLTVK
jgi:uncharacterized cupredoxin-like copper-binding protein